MTPGLSSSIVLASESVQPAEEALLLDAILSSLRLRAPLGPILLTQLEAVRKAADHTPLDWWLLCALSAGTDAKSRSRASKLLCDKAARQLLKPPLLRSAILSHGAGTHAM